MHKIIVPEWLFQRSDVKGEEKWLYLFLLKKYEEVKEPGKSGLALPLEVFGREIAPRSLAPASMIRNGLRLLAEAEIITARRLDYPADYPEWWAIGFLKKV